MSTHNVDKNVGNPGEGEPSRAPSPPPQEGSNEQIRSVDRSESDSDGDSEEETRAPEDAPAPAPAGAKKKRRRRRRRRPLRSEATASVVDSLLVFDPPPQTSAAELQERIHALILGRGSPSAPPHPPSVTPSKQTWAFDPYRGMVSQPRVGLPAASALSSQHLVSTSPPSASFFGHPTPMYNPTSGPRTASPPQPLAPQQGTYDESATQYGYPMSGSERVAPTLRSPTRSPLRSGLDPHAATFEPRANIPQASFGHSMYGGVVDVLFRSQTIMCRCSIPSVAVGFSVIVRFVDEIPNEGQRPFHDLGRVLRASVAPDRSGLPTIVKVALPQEVATYQEFTCVELQTETEAFARKVVSDSATLRGKIRDISCEWTFDHSKVVVKFVADKVLKFTEIVHSIHRRYNCRVQVLQTNRNRLMNTMSEQEKQELHAQGIAGPRHKNRSPARQRHPTEPQPAPAILAIQAEVPRVGNNPQVMTPPQSTSQQTAQPSKADQ